MIPTVEVATIGASAPAGESSPAAAFERHARVPYGRGRAAWVAAAAGIVGAGSLTMAFGVLVGSPVRSGSLSPGFRPFLPVLAVAVAARAGLFLIAVRCCDRRTRDRVEEVVGAAKAAAAGTAVIIVFTFYWQGAASSPAAHHARSVLLLDWVFATVGSLCLAARAKSAVNRRRRQGHDVRHVVVVGASPSATRFITNVTRQPELGYRVVRHLSTGPAPGDLEAALVAIASRQQIHEILFAGAPIGADELNRLLAIPDLRRVQLRVVPDLLGSAPAQARAESVGEFPLLTLLNEPLPGVRRSVKRMIDVVLACLGLVIAGPMMLATAIAIKARSPGTVLFRQQRIGMNGRPFEMLKFRTMPTGADTRAHEAFVTELIRGNGHQPDGTLYKLVGDNRVTALGRFLRRFSIDETPQLLNVLRGDMSVVGPRPPLPYEVALYEDWHRRRLEAKPGLTGLWQVSGRSRLTFEQMVRLDLRYIENWSPLLDLRIALRTIPAMFRRDAA